MENILIRRLREAIAEKKIKNPKYSLRAFARQTAIPAPTLSRLLAGQWNLTLPMARKLVRGIADSPDERKRLLRAFALGPEKHATKPTRYRYLSLPELQALQHWGYSAVLEWLRGRSAERSEAVIARATGLSELETREILQGLRKLQLVERSMKHGWKSKRTNLSSIRWEGHAPWIEIHQGYADRAVQYLNQYDREKSTIQGITLLVDSKRLEEARERIREFAEELSDDLAADGDGLLYRLNVQLFPLGV